MFEKFLQEIGLSEKEAQIYLSLLKYDSATPSKLSKETDIKRSTVYVVLEELERKGLVTEAETGKVLHYQANPPERLETYVEQQKLKLQETEKRLADLIPQLRSVQRQSGARPVIRVAYGKEAALGQNIEFFSAEHKEGVGYFIFNQDLLNKHYTESELAHVRKIRPKIKIPGKSIYNAKITIPSDELTERKQVDSQEYPISSDISIFEDRVHIVTLGEQVTTILIQSKEVANTLKTLFKLAFRSIE